MPNTCFCKVYFVTQNPKELSITKTKKIVARPNLKKVFSFAWHTWNRTDNGYPTYQEGLCTYCSTTRMRGRFGWFVNTARRRNTPFPPIKTRTATTTLQLDLQLASRTRMEELQGGDDTDGFDESRSSYLEGSPSFCIWMMVVKESRNLNWTHDELHAIVGLGWQTSNAKILTRFRAKKCGEAWRLRRFLVSQH